MAIRVYKPSQPIRPKKVIKKKENKDSVDTNMLKFWKKRLPNVSATLIEATIHQGKVWILYMMYQKFENPKKIHDHFYTWASLEMRKAGRKKIEEAIKIGAPLYQFLQQHKISREKNELEIKTLD